MAEFKLYLEEQKAEFEPNSVAGKAIDYILNRWTQLSQFLRHLHAPMDTNIVERALMTSACFLGNKVFRPILEPASPHEKPMQHLFAARLLLSN